ncbi:hypothetical protein PX690_21445 [Bacillus velezensis]|uniref:hypothetical protein n=1 Tax=Bacillus velezensis TaxID=492670 RepID=UPI0023E2987D|nr:hypothetical protein [Bacillus velezensis]WES02035.1 hypothetical protein PX690_21445 [Bacillus velezensis]
MKHAKANDLNGPDPVLSEYNPGKYGYATSEKYFETLTNYMKTNPDGLVKDKDHPDGVGPRKALEPVLVAKYLKSVVEPVSLSPTNFQKPLCLKEPTSKQQETDQRWKVMRVRNLKTRPVMSLPMRMRMKKKMKIRRWRTERLHHKISQPDAIKLYKDLLFMIPTH